MSRSSAQRRPENVYLSDWIANSYPHAHAVALIREPLTNIAAIRKRRYAHRLPAALALYNSTYGAAFHRLVAKSRTQLARYD